jgi:4-hydroxy-tetrahydrodipicolinate reductase
MKVGIVGYRGKMGQAILAEAEKHDDISIAILHSRYFQNETEVTVTDSIQLLVEQCDVVIDFSRPDTSLQVIESSIKSGVAVVCGTTGFTTKEMDYIGKLSHKGKIFYSANMSLGVAILSHAVELVVEKLIKNDIVPDIAILERHHKHKVDKPSGTAISLASMINHRFHNIIPEISSLRYGSNVGEHELMIANETEVITLKHEATDRRVFASGAIAAARFLHKQKLNGLYTINDIIY